jgi:hypothetical protein
MIKKTITMPVNGVYPEADGVRIWHDGHTFKVPLHSNKGDWPLLNKEGWRRSEQDTNDLKNEAEAICDWDFATATKRIQELGTDIPLAEGEYLPTAPVMIAMYIYRHELNAALEKLGGEPINFDNIFWFAARYDVTGAWFFYGYYGSLYGSGVGSSYRCQAVAL